LRGGRVSASNGARSSDPDYRVISRNGRATMPAKRADIFAVGLPMDRRASLSGSPRRNGTNSLPLTNGVRGLNPVGASALRNFRPMGGWSCGYLSEVWI
jgi:hypothetical protein